MTIEEKKAMVQVLIEDPTVTETQIDIYLTLAKAQIMERAYPYVEKRDEIEVPSKYDCLHCELAVAMIAKRGSEMQTTSIENGIHRNYGGANFDAILCEVVPQIGVV